MISCKLYGRTGNQLFQIAATIGHAVRNGYDYGFPKSSENPAIWPKVNVHLPILTGDEKFSGYYHEHSHRFQQIPDLDNLILNGYFQSYKYFWHIIPKLRELFNAPNLTQWGQVAIHVRRGDYLKFPDKHPVLPMEYYRIAIDYIVRAEGWKETDFEITVFTDDFDWCNANFTKQNFGYGCFIKNPNNEPPEDDLYAIASCQHNIIANSSFSYWAAILNPNPQKIICSPFYQQWFGEGNKHLDTLDLIPPDWVQINY